MAALVLYDEDGKTTSGLFDDLEPVDMYDLLEDDVIWEKLSSHHEDEYTGEATIDRDLLQRQQNDASIGKIQANNLPSWMCS